MFWNFQILLWDKNLPLSLQSYQKLKWGFLCGISNSLLWIYCFLSTNKKSFIFLLWKLLSYSFFKKDIHYVWKSRFFHLLYIFKQLFNNFKAPFVSIIFNGNNLIAFQVFMAMKFFFIILNIKIKKINWRKKTKINFYLIIVFGNMYNLWKFSKSKK